jgi:hypothetical protein
VAKTAGIGSTLKAQRSQPQLITKNFRLKLDGLQVFETGFELIRTEGLFLNLDFRKALSYLIAFSDPFTNINWVSHCNSDSSERK